MREIQLTQGKVALVDDEDYNSINKLKWYAHCQSGTFYAMRHTPKTLAKPRGLIGMHRFIMNPTEEFEIDHINGNGLDNRKQNLRIVTTRENQQNQHGIKTSKFPGVSWKSQHSQWYAQIQVDGKCYGIGLFDTEEEAYERYKLQVERVNNGLPLLPNISKKTSKYKGVYWCNTHNKWTAAISIKRKSKYLGGFNSEDEAHIRYEQVSKLLKDWSVIDA